MSSKIAPAQGDASLEEEFVQAQKEMKTEEVRCHVIASIGEFAVGVVLVCISLPMWLAPGCMTSMGSCVPTILFACISIGGMLDGMRRIVMDTINGNIKIAFAGSNKVSDEAMKGVIPGDPRRSAVDRVQSIGFASLSAADTLESLIEEGRVVKSSRTQKRLLLADARVRLLQDLFAAYTEGSPAMGSIDCNGLITVMVDTMADGNLDSISLGEAKRFMARIDKNGDMLLQRDEFYDFILNFWKRESPLSTNGVYAAVDDLIFSMHKKRVHSRASTEMRACEVTKPRLDGKVEEDIYKNERVKDIFNYYDIEKTGNIDCNGLMDLIKDLVSPSDGLGDLTLAEVKAFLNQVDENGDMLLQADELAAYLLGGKWKESAPKAKAFKSGEHFVQTQYESYAEKIRERWKKSTGFLSDDSPNQNKNKAADDLMNQMVRDGKKEGAGASAPEKPKALPPIIERKLRDLVDTLWEEYDRDSTGELDGEQLQLLLSDTIATEIPKDECDRFIQCIDTDGNTGIAKSEFRNFCAEGLFMHESQKEAYIARSTMHSHIVVFFTTIENQLRTRTVLNDAPISFTGATPRREEFDEEIAEAEVEAFAKEEEAKEKKQEEEALEESVKLAEEEQTAEAECEKEEQKLPEQ
jgi:Ca2+-binding EF-hand superfamily protein